MFMGYGITSTSQIIDINAIKNGCNQIKQYVADFEACGSLVVVAGENCTEKALAIDENTFPRRNHYYRPLRASWCLPCWIL